MENATTQGFTTFERFQKVSGLEQHGITVDYDIFVDLQKPDQQPRDRPNLVYHAVDLNFELEPHGKAVDAGVIIPNINDGFNGSAPDLGALETGMPIPIYGVRRLPVDKEFYR